MTVLSESAPPDVCPTPESFWLWVLDALDLPVHRFREDAYEAGVPEDRRASFGGRHVIRFRWPDGGVRHEPTAESWEGPAGWDDSGRQAEVLAAGSPLGELLLNRLKKRRPVIHAAPRDQPTSVHELAPHLFLPYDIQGGTVRLSGCSLDDEPLLRYTYNVWDEDGGTRPNLVHVYASAEQLPVELSLLTTLRVSELVPISSCPLPLANDQIDAWLAYGERQAMRQNRTCRVDFLLATVIWCKRARGKLLFQLGDSSAERSFDLWAQHLVDGVATPLPFRCPATGRESYHVAATDDGRITVAESIACCEHSGARVLDSELEACAVTGKRVLNEFLHVCPVTGERVLTDELDTCAQCRQHVSPRAVAGGRCQACRSLQRVSPDDPRLARILGEYPRLDGWSRWQLAETSSVYVLTARSLLRRLLLVLDKESLEALRMATGFRLSQQPPEVPPEQWGEFLG